MPRPDQELDPAAIEDLKAARARVRSLQEQHTDLAREIEAARDDVAQKQAKVFPVRLRQRAAVVGVDARDFDDMEALEQAVDMREADRARVIERRTRMVQARHDKRAKQSKSRSKQA